MGRRTDINVEKGKQGFQRTKPKPAQAPQPAFIAKTPQSDSARFEPDYATVYGVGVKPDFVPDYLYYEKIGAQLREKTASTAGPLKADPYMTKESPAYAIFREEYLNTTIPADEDKAAKIAEAVHFGQTDQSGAPYILHPCGVVQQMTELPEYKMLSSREQRVAKEAAWLHDTLEDTVLSPADLKAAGFSEEVISVIDSVTSREGEDKDDYYERVKAGGPIAIAVKVGDLGHNNLPERRESLPGSPSNPVGEGELDRFTKLGKKYFKAYTALGATVPEHLKEFAPD